VVNKLACLGFAVNDLVATGTLSRKTATLDGKVTIAKLNVDENPRTAARYGIRSIPTLLLFKGGERVDQVIGAVPRNVIQSKIGAHLE